VQLNVQCGGMETLAMVYLQIHLQLGSNSNGMKFSNIYFHDDITITGDDITLIGCNVGSTTSGTKTITISSAANKTIVQGCRTEASISDSGTNTTLLGNHIF
jgi:hypothetical protein